MNLAPQAPSPPGTFEPGPVLRIAIVAIALVAAATLLTRLSLTFGEALAPAAAQGAGTADAPYSDALGPWLHGSVWYLFRDQPVSYLYRPTIGLFFSTLISIGRSVRFVPEAWIGLFFVLNAGLFLVGRWQERLALAANLAIFALFFHELVRPLNPEALMADFWPMYLGVAGVWMVAYAAPVGAAAGVAAGFLLLGIAACVRGPQLLGGVALLAFVLVPWLRRRQFALAIAGAAAFALPLAIDGFLQKRHGIENNGTVILYSVYSDENHQWSPATHARFAAEHPSRPEVRAKYLAFVASAAGAKLIASRLAEIFNEAADSIYRLPFLVLAACTAAIAAAGRPAAGAGATSTWLGPAVVVLLWIPGAFLPSGPARALLLGGLTVAWGIAAIRTGRRVSAMLATVFLGSAALHASLGLTGGHRVAASYEVFLLLAFVMGAAETPSDPSAPALATGPLRLLALGTCLLVAIGYTGNFWIRREMKADIRRELSHGNTVVKLSDSPRLDRSLWLTSDMGLFYTRLDPSPFGAARQYVAIEAPAGFGNVTFLSPLSPRWVATPSRAGSDIVK